MILTFAAGQLAAQTEPAGLSPVDDPEAVSAEDDAATPAPPGTPEDAVPSAESPDNSTIWLDAIRADELGPPVRSSVILLGPDGILRCSLFRLDHTTRQEIPVKQMEIKLILDGKDIETMEPNPEDGTFQFGPVKPGIYSLIGYGEDGFVAFSFAVDQLPAEAAEKEAGAEEPVDAENPPAQELTSLEPIHGSTLDPKDVPMALQLIRAFVDGGRGGGVDAEESDTEGAMAEPLVEEPAKTDSRPFRKLTRDAKIPLITSLKWHTVRLQPDGTLIGRIMTLVEINQDGEVKAVPPEDMQVFVLKDGQVVSRAPCSEKGIFAIPDLKADIYSFVGVGRDGFVALTVDVLPAEKEEEKEGAVKSASFRRIAYLQNQNFLNIFTTIVPLECSKFIQLPLQNTQLIAQNTGLPLPLTAGDTPSGGTQPSSNGSSGISPVSASGLGANPGGSGGGGGGGGGGGSGGDGGGSGGDGGGSGGGGGGSGGGGGTNGSVPEIDPASSGVGLSVLIGLLFLLIDLYRPR